MDYSQELKEIGGLPSNGFQKLMRQLLATLNAVKCIFNRMKKNYIIQVGHFIQTMTNDIGDVFPQNKKLLIAFDMKENFMVQLLKCNMYSWEDKI